MLQNQGPADLATRMNPTALGPGARVLNAYPLMASRAAFEGQRAAAPEKRVAILARSAWAGSQRYARHRVVGGRGGALEHPARAGAGGAVVLALRDAVVDDRHRRLQRGRSRRPRLARPTASSTPAGSSSAPSARSSAPTAPTPPREPWLFGAPGHPAWKSLLRFAELRYRLLPYLYTLASRVTREHDTMMRALVMDFPDDPKARDVQDQYLFGPAFLVSPVTAPGVTTRAVYLPEGAWYDFWTGLSIEGGRTIDAPAPYESMPLHVRAGSIVPFGPALQWTGERRPTRSGSSSTPAATAASRSTRTTARRTRTRRAPSRRSRCRGPRRRAR